MNVSRCNEVSTINNNHYGFVFSDKMTRTDIMKHFMDNNIHYYDDMTHILKSKATIGDTINILEVYDSQGLCDEIIIPDTEIDELPTQLCQCLQTIPRPNEKGNVDHVTLNTVKKRMTDGSTLITIGYGEIMDYDENITHLFYDSYNLIVNIPIIE